MLRSTINLPLLLIDKTYGISSRASSLLLSQNQTYSTTSVLSLKFTSFKNANETHSNKRTSTSDKNANEDKNSPSNNAGDLHFKLTPSQHPLGEEIIKKTKIVEGYWDNPIPHPIYTKEELENVQKTHHEVKKVNDRLALFAVKLMRTGFDIASRYKGPGGEMTKRDWLNRCLFLETIAGVPGMVAGMARHLKSLRSMKRDYGWIHTLLEEAENERMHLLIFMNLKDPNILFRLMVIGAQGIFFNVFFLTYLFAPRTCHRFVGYLEEEAVKTYTGLISDIDNNPNLNEWKSIAAPLIGSKYYKLPENATVRDLILCIRADEANHRDVNHTFASLDYEMDKNPFLGKHQRKT